MTPPFNRWFAGYLGQNEVQVARLMRDRTAVQFLITWSLFESKCFGGYVQEKLLLNYAKSTSSRADYRSDPLIPIAKHFHERYQDKTRYRHLLHKNRSALLESLLAKGFDDLSDSEVLFVLLFVVYRYRNNIFHGNKGVETWLRYRQQIEGCIAVMQQLLEMEQATHTHVEAAL